MLIKIPPTTLLIKLIFLYTLFSKVLKIQKAISRVTITYILMG